MAIVLAALSLLGLGLGAGIANGLVSGGPRAWRGRRKMGSCIAVGGALMAGRGAAGLAAKGGAAALSGGAAVRGGAAAAGGASTAYSLASAGQSGIRCGIRPQAVWRKRLAAPPSRR